jgi:hypothetical protein
MSVHPEPKGVKFREKPQVRLISPRGERTQLDLKHPLHDAYGNTFYPYMRGINQVPEIFWIQRRESDLPNLKEYLEERRAVKYGQGIILLPHLRYGVLQTPETDTFDVWQNFYDPNDLFVYNLEPNMSPNSTERWWMTQQRFNEWCVKTVEALTNCMAALGYTEFNVTPYK